MSRTTPERRLYVPRLEMPLQTGARQHTYSEPRAKLAVPDRYLRRDSLPITYVTVQNRSAYRGVTRDPILYTLKQDSDIPHTLLQLPQDVTHAIESIDNSTLTEPTKLALIIPAYNESLVLAHTIHTAIAAGMSKEDIYVVDDSSSDDTAEIATQILGEQNVLTVARSGKGLAISKITNAFQLTHRYKWIHVADADGEFDQHYFTELHDNLNDTHAAATGYVTSLPGGYISKYRTFEYAIGMDVIRRFQNIAKVITIIPGPTSIFRNDVFDKLRFSDDALCEDFDVTLQIHRNQLGSIQFIPGAIARTQDPASFKDFIKQINRWNRGVLQMFFKHRIGHKATRVDAYLTYQVLQNLLFFLMYFIWIPIVTYTSESILYLSLSFLSDVILVFGFALFAASRTNQYGILAAFPLIYALRWVSLLVFIKSFVEVVIFGKYRHANGLGLWETVVRRRQKALLPASS